MQVVEWPRAGLLGDLHSVLEVVSTSSGTDETSDSGFTFAMTSALTSKSPGGRLPTTAVSGEVLDALDHLSHLTGLAKVWLVRSFIEERLSDLGLIDVASAPTKRKRSE